MMSFVNYYYVCLFLNGVEIRLVFSGEQVAVIENFKIGKHSSNVGQVAPQFRFPNRRASRLRHKQRYTLALFLDKALDKHQTSKCLA